MTSNGNEFTIGPELIAGQDDITIRANYKPIVNSAQVNVAAPQKDETLANSASASVTLANSAFSQPTVVASQIVWSPAAGSDGKASEDTEYEVAMKLTYQKALSDTAAWSYAYVDGAYLTAPGSSYASLNTKESDAYVLFAENATSNLISVDPVEDLVVPYEKNSAAAIKNELDSQRRTVSIEANNGTDLSANITWETPKLVADGGKLNGAQWRARGKLTLPENVQAQDVYVYADITVEPATRFNLIHVDQPADVYDVAAGADEVAVRAVLETSTDLILEEGVIEQGTIAWEKVECVDPEGTATYGAKWTATGKVSLPASVTNANNVSLDVTMDVYTALAPVEENPISMPYTMPEEDIYDQEKIITLHTDEPNGVIWYRIVDSDADTATNFVEYVDGSPIYLERETIDANDILVIEAYTMVGAQKSEDATFVYEFDTSVHIPEGDELVFDGTEQVGVWGYGDYTLMNPSSGARVDESGDACATNVGTYKVTAKLDSNRKWFVDWPEDEAEPTTTTEDQVVAFSIVPASITYCDIDLVQNATYTGKAINPKPNLTLGDYVLVEGRDYTLSYSNNVNVGKAKVTITGKGNFIDSEVLEFEIIGEEPEPEPNPEPKPEPQPKPEPEPKPNPEPPAQLPVSYGGHAQTYGDLQAGKDGEVLGTTGQSKRLEAFWATVEGGSIEYRSHLQKIGWEDTWKHDGEISGTTGQSRRIEAVRIRLTGGDAD